MINPKSLYIYLTNGKNWVSAPKIIPVVGIWPYLPRAIGAWWFPGEGGSSGPAHLEMSKGA